jgi:hypothetical protein
MRNGWVQRLISGLPDSRLSANENLPSAVIPNDVIKHRPCHPLSSVLRAIVVSLKLRDRHTVRTKISRPDWTHKIDDFEISLKVFE